MIEALLISLAVWRVSYMVVEEDGPFYMFARLRRLAGVDREGEQSGMAILFTCIYCVSVWVAAFLWLLLKREDMYLILVYSALAIGYNHALSYTENRGN